MVALVANRLVSRLNGLSRLNNPFNRLNRLTGDERGAILVQFALLVPIFILIAVGSFEVWKAISVKRSLHSGTYQATRYLSLNPVEPLDPEEWREVAEGFIIPELANNGFVEDDAARWVDIYITPPMRLGCNEPFTVIARLPWRAVIPYLSRTSWMLVDQHEGRIVCGP